MRLISKIIKINLVIFIALLINISSNANEKKIEDFYYLKNLTPLDLVNQGFTLESVTSIQNNPVTLVYTFGQFILGLNIGSVMTPLSKEEGKKINSKIRITSDTSISSIYQNILDQSETVYVIDKNSNVIGFVEPKRLNKNAIKNLVSCIIKLDINLNNSPICFNITNKK